MHDLPGLALDRSLRVRPGQFIDQAQAKSLIVVHHTADGSPKASLNWWNQDPKRIATAYVVDRDGTVHETFDPSRWAYHTGTGSALDKRSVGIELTNWGWLTKKDGRYYNWRGGEIDASDVVEAPWRGQHYWQRYPQAQIDALLRLVPAVCDRFDIDRDCAPGVWGERHADYKRFKRFEGVITHAHVRADKTDLSPAFPWSDLTVAVERRR